MCRHSVCAILVNQGKTGKKLRIVLESSELNEVIERIKVRAVVGDNKTLVQSDKGLPLSYKTFSNYFNRAREAARETYPELADELAEFQLRDICALAATDIEEIGSASKLLGHSKENITKRVYRRRGETVKPTR